MGSRADNKDGSCREIINGKHVGKWRVQYTQTLETGKKERISRIFPTKTAGKEFLQGLRHGEKVETARRNEELSLGSWLEWLAENDWPLTLSETTITYRRRRFAKYVREHLGHVPLAKIDPMTVSAFYRHLKDEGASDSVVLSVKGDLVRVFNQAVLPYRRVPATLANPFKLPLAQPRIRDAVALTPDAARKALSSEKLDTSRLAMLGLFLLGAVRLGEQMALTMAQVRWDDDLISVDRAVKVAFGGKQTVGLPKGGKTRSVVMCPTLKALLWEHAKDLGPDDLLWPAATANQPRMKKLVYATWRTILKDAKLPPEMSPHDARLSSINWIEKLMPEVSPTTLKEHVGHAGAGVTEVRYTRPLTTAQAVLRDGLERVAGLPKSGRTPKTVQASSRKRPVART